MAWRILSACGISYRSIRHIATGATSEAWAIDSSDGRLVLRVAAPRAGERARYEAEFAIRDRLRSIGGKVARPVATNRDVDVDTGFAWCLDEFIDGVTCANGRLSDHHCRELGATLALLHELPVDGFGPLIDRREPLAGEQRDVVGGLRSRWTTAWPFDGSDIADQPLATLDPGLTREIAARREGLLDASRGQPVAVCHSDLHGGQIPSDGRGLAARLDFGDAIAGWPVWDVASFRFFHGGERTERLLEGYCDAPGERATLRERAELLSIMLALHQIGRGQREKQSSRVPAGRNYLACLVG